LLLQQHQQKKTGAHCHTPASASAVDNQFVTPAKQSAVIQPPTDLDGNIPDKALQICHDCFLRPSPNIHCVYTYCKIRLTEMIVENQLTGTPMHEKVMRKMVDIFKNKQGQVNNAARQVVLEQGLLGTVFTTEGIIDCFNKLDLHVASVSFLGSRLSQKRRQDFTSDHVSTLLYRIFTYGMRGTKTTNKKNEDTLKLEKLATMNMNKVRFYPLKANSEDRLQSAICSDVVQTCIKNKLETWVIVASVNPPAPTSIVIPPKPMCVCGSLLPIDARFCSQCGNAVSNSTTHVRR
jgi:hypothetical protein